VFKKNTQKVLTIFGRETPTLFLNECKGKVNPGECCIPTFDFESSYEGGHNFE